MSANNETFKEWISYFEQVNRPIGDLAKDINFDDSFPKTNKKETILDYLDSKSAKSEAIRAFEEAWIYYQVDKA